MMRCLIYALAFVALFSTTPIVHARQLQNIVCDVADAACAASCSVSGGSYYKYYCNTDTCGCSNNPVGACFPGEATVETPSGPKHINQIALGDDVLTVSASGERQFNKVRNIYNIHVPYLLHYCSTLS